MIKTSKAVIVEGKYDKIRLASVIDSPLIIDTDGFSIFNDKEKLSMIRKIAETTGIIILTDSDSAGFRIRSYLKGAIPQENITNVYIPDIKGKEKRKTVPSKEGTLGVEGMPADVLTEAFAKAGVGNEACETGKRLITKLDLYEDGFTGGSKSRSYRDELKKRLGLPSKLSSTSLICVLNTLCTYEEYKKMAEEIKNGKA